MAEISLNNPQLRIIDLRSFFGLAWHIAASVVLDPPNSFQSPMAEFPG
jgi:cystathionine beta-lyase/cystathionine gamma-synthase